MGTFVLAWVLVFSTGNSVSYSPPVKTLADCKALREAAMPIKSMTTVYATCISVDVLVVK